MNVKRDLASESVADWKRSMSVMGEDRFLHEVLTTLREKDARIIELGKSLTRKVEENRSLRAVHEGQAEWLCSQIRSIIGGRS